MLLFVEDKPTSKLQSSSGAVQFHKRLSYPFKVLSITLGLVTFYILFIRGFLHYMIHSQIHDGYGDVFESNFGSESRTTHQVDINPSPMKYASHKMAIQIASKMAASGFWTSQNSFAFMKHLVGFATLSYSWYALLTARKVGLMHLVEILLPLNMFTALFCHGIPSLSMSCYIWILLICIESFLL